MKTLIRNNEKSRLGLMIQVMIYSIILGQPPMNVSVRLQKKTLSQMKRKT